MASYESRPRPVNPSQVRRRPKSLVVGSQEAGLIAPSLEIHGHSRSESAALSRGQLTKPEGASFRGILRRASTSLRVKFHRRPTLSSNPVFEEQLPEARPTTAHATWHRLRQAASFRQNRPSYGESSDTSQRDLDQIIESMATLPVPSIGASVAEYLYNSGSGSSDLESGSYSVRNKWLSHVPGEECGNDRESGIGITVGGSVSDADLSESKRASMQAQEGTISRIDFVTQLPAELAIQILSLLDAPGLLTASQSFLREKTATIYCLQFDEFKIITGSRDKTIRIWDMHTYQCKLVIGPPEVLSDISILIDEDKQPAHYATLSNNQRVAHSMPALVSFPIHHKASVLCLQYDDKILVTGSSDASCIVYKVNSGYRPIRRLRHHTAAVLDLVFDEKHIVTCSKDISICVWDRETGALLRRLKGHAGPVNAVQMRGNTIVSCSGDFRVKLWNIDTGKNIREFAGHTKGLACSQFSEDGRYIASAGNDKVIRIWDANTGECLREMKAHDGLVRSLHIDSVSGRLISGSYDTNIKVFDMDTGASSLTFLSGMRAGFSARRATIGGL
ncbi:unnamed protein product [Parascedosporium putredinis]|uniref:WD40 repeat-like protein n=1 Tax=Parascedosporium putredinis TaxID=1442378 RepID=A0A9P1MC79_9PEZI|nr:unnamed protein product [Parascedosporium putredinis]CAI8001072.1 unnamed protein product [Parascedosporium putredinis]